MSTSLFVIINRFISFIARELLPLFIHIRYAYLSFVIAASVSSPFVCLFVRVFYTSADVGRFSNIVRKVSYHAPRRLSGAVSIYALRKLISLLSPFLFIACLFAPTSRIQCRDLSLCVPAPASDTVALAADRHL